MEKFKRGANVFFVILGGLGSVLIFAISLPSLRFAIQSVYNQLMALEVERTKETGIVVFRNAQGEVTGRVQ